MIRLALKSGVVLDNDPRHGWNLDSVTEIQECLNNGCYRYHDGKRWRDILPGEVDSVYEDDTPTPKEEEKEER